MSCLWLVSAACRLGAQLDPWMEAVDLVSLSMGFLQHDDWTGKQVLWGFRDGSVVKNLPANAGDMGSIPRPGLLQSN